MVYNVTCSVCDIITGSFDYDGPVITEDDPRLNKLCGTHAPAASDPTPTAPPAITPAHGPVGTSVTISLRSLETAVMFNGIAADNPRMAGYDLVVDVPPGATTGALSVTPPGMGSVSLGTFAVE